MITSTTTMRMMTMNSSTPRTLLLEATSLPTTPMSFTMMPLTKHCQDQPLYEIVCCYHCHFDTRS
jgi:hypothetical protein